jgi:hypothetical protein
MLDHKPAAGAVLPAVHGRRPPGRPGRHRGVLGKHQISIASVIQHEPSGDGGNQVVPLVIMTILGPTLRAKTKVTELQCFMPFDYDECRSVLLQALVTVLQDNRERIRALHESEEIWALAYEIIPWQPFAAFSIRVRDETDGNLRYDLAAWKHYEFACNINTPVLKEIADYCAAAVTGPQAADNSGDKSQEVAHLIYLAAAEALLAPEVSAFLRPLGINVPVATDTLDLAYLEFVVFDPDKTLKCNYCEIIRANRVTKRLLGRTI